MLQVNETAGGGFSISINFCSTLCTSIFQVPSDFHILPAETDAKLPWMCSMQLVARIFRSIQTDLHAA